MSRPDDHRGAPPGGYGGPSAAPPGAPATGWAPVGPAAWAGSPGGSGWSAAVTGPGGGPAPGPAGPPDPGSWGPGPAGVPVARGTLDPAKLFGLVIAGLGGLNFAFGFLPQVTASRIDQSLSVYAVGPGYVPILLLIAGLLALAAFLPGSERSRLAVAAVSVGGAVGALISLGTSSSLELLAAGQVSKGLGAVLLTIFGIIQAVVAIGGYVVGADVRTARGSASGAGSPVGAGSPAGAGRAAGPAPGAVPQAWGTVAPGPVWPTAEPSPPPAASHQVPGSQPGPGFHPAGPSAPPAGLSGWGPPAADDRPTGPQRVVDPSAAAPDPTPAVGPAWAGPADRADRPAEPGSVTPPAGPDNGATEVHRIPPRPGAGDAPGS